MQTSTGTSHEAYIRTGTSQQAYIRIGPPSSHKSQFRIIPCCILTFSSSFALCTVVIVALGPALLDAIFYRPPVAGASVAKQPFDLRVTKGFGTRDYSEVRISLITQTSTPPSPEFFDYSEQFKYRWTDKFLHSSLKVVPAGGRTDFDVGANISVHLPAQGAGVAGVLIADPCVNSEAGSWVDCQFGDKYQTIERIPLLINAFAEHGGIDFWSIVGDNFYDREGKISSDVFARFSLQAKSLFFFTVVGNHDLWAYGFPELGAKEDQCGNGFMQFYAQDTKAAEALGAGSSAPIFNFSVDPDSSGFLGFGCSRPRVENFFWYNQLGNVGFVGQSGAHNLFESLPLMKEACAWLPRQPGLDVVILMGHWDTEDLGAADDMAMPFWYRQMVSLPGCQEFADRGMLKYVMGHTHCNSPHPRGDPGTGFRVAGFGMEGCGNFGIPVVDTSEGRVRFWYFDMLTETAYESVIDCIMAAGWRNCTHLATSWLDQPILSSATIR